MDTKPTPVNAGAAVNFMFELAQLREKPRTGWELIKVPRKETVAAHVLRVAQLAYVLAVMEGHSDPNHVAMCALFHENDETRLPDIHKVAKRYLGNVEKDAVVRDQTAPMGDLGAQIFAFWAAAHDTTSWAGVIAKDADRLENAFTAKEYAEQGIEFANDWILNAKKTLVTTSAQLLCDKMIIMDSNDWWQGLKKLD